MDSHVISNTYHQPHYQTIGHEVLRSTRESLSSESSCNQNSPEYPQNRQPEYGRQYEQNQDQYWSPSQDWSRNQTINMTRSQDTSSDEEENIEVQEVSFSESASMENLLLSENDNVEDNSLIEGDDYDVIQVYAVDPNLDLEASSDDEVHEDYVKERTESDEEYLNNDDNLSHKEIQAENQSITSDVLNFNLDTPVVSNVDEYFVKEEKDILAEIDDEPVVNDVDEYFIKETKPNESNVIVESKPEDENHFHISDAPVNVDEFFVTNTVKVPEKVIEQDIPEVIINESDLPNIEELKRYLLEDMTYSKFKSAQRSCSLPQSPMHNICLDLEDAKTCLSFEDLNLDLSDLTFESDKDKAGVKAKSDDNLRTLTEEDVNSFLITNKPTSTILEKYEDDFTHQDMEIERPVESKVNPIEIPTHIPDSNCSSISTPKSNVLNFCIEKTCVKKEKTTDIKTEPEDFVDVESCNDSVIPVLEANNLNSLLEQFEATEKLNTKPKKLVIKTEEQKAKSVSLTNGMRLQDAGVQLNKNKMRQILMPSTINATVRRSPSPVHSDHDYCSSNKKRYSLPNIKGGQSLLKPEVLSSNSRILNSRHRSCKNKKIVYNLSSDDESEKCNNKTKKVNNRSDDSDIKIKKPSGKTIKVITNPTRKKLSPKHSVSNDTFKDKSNDSVINKDACKASDTPCSQNYNGSIKLTIKNKSEVILNCDDKDSQKNKTIENYKSSSVSEKAIKVDVKDNIKNKSVKSKKEIDSEKNKRAPSIETTDNYTNVHIKEESRPKEEHFYTALFSNKQDVQIPQVLQIKPEKRSFEEEIGMLSIANKTETDQPQKKKKLNLQEYKLRRGFNSNNSSATVSPEAIFPDMPISFPLGKTKSIPNRTPPTDASNVVKQINAEASKKIFDPIREASRKILMNTKKQKAEAMRKRDEDIVMSKIPKVQNLELQPLISDAEMMKIVGMAPAKILPVPIEKPQLQTEYDEIVMVSVGINTDDTVFKEIEKSMQRIKKSLSPKDCKSVINFKIKKSDHVLKQNVFDAMKRDKRSPVDDKKHSETKIDKERFKDITATLKSVGRHVDTKISSNSLFASIQDVVMKKAPEEDEREKRPKSISPKRKPMKPMRTTIVREYDTKAEHGEDKVILHLGKDRRKPHCSNMIIQTDSDPDFADLCPKLEIVKSPTNRKRNDSDMSMSSESSPVRTDLKEDTLINPKPERREINRSLSKEKRSRSKERHDKYRRSRSPSRTRRRRRSHSRSRSRSRGRFKRYRRSDSPYRRKRLSRSPYRSRRSPSNRRDYRSKRSRSRNTDPTRSKSPVTKKLKSPQRNGVDRKAVKSLTPPLRKPTISESSESSTSSSSSSSSEDSRKSRRSCSQKSRSSCSPFRRENYRKKGFRNYNSSEDRESNTPVEERRIVFVGKLEKDITKSSLGSQFSKFGTVLEVRLHSKEDGSRYGFVTYQRARDAWNAVEAAGTFPQYDVGFGGRRAFCRQSYADLDGLEAKYTESAFHGQPSLPVRRSDDMSFEQMLLDMKKKLSQRKTDKKRPEDATA